MQPKREEYTGTLLLLTCLIGLEHLQKPTPLLKQHITWIPNKTGAIDILVVGGGGGGGVVQKTTDLLENTSITVIVGNGGTGSTNFNNKGYSGYDSTFDNVLAKRGGGAGSRQNSTALSGGSGGGGGCSNDANEADSDAEADDDSDSDAEADSDEADSDDADSNSDSDSDSDADADSDAEADSDADDKAEEEPIAKPKRALSIYNHFVRAKMAEVRAENSTMPPKERMGRLWKEQKDEFTEEFKKNAVVE
jgi:hypothetical protein